jgi:4a-hydroxytetrahydrobiopterin dehydratase
MTHLADKHCENNPALLDANSVQQLALQVDSNWCIATDNKSIHRRFDFKNYYETMAFVNVVAMIAHQQNHHPDLAVHYNHCMVEFSTHKVHGLSEYDFICAAKIDNILPL